MSILIKRNYRLSRIRAVLKLLDQIDRGQIEKDFGVEQCLIFMKEDIDFVESSFDRIMESSGSHAKVILWNLFVDEKTQQQVADEFGITRRQLQYSMNKWLHALLGQS